MGLVSAAPTPSTPSTPGEVAEAITEARSAGTALVPRRGGSVLARLPAGEGVGAGQDGDDGATAGPDGDDGATADTVPADPVGAGAVGTRPLDLGGLTGIVERRPEDLTLTVRAGTRLDEVAGVLAASGQECPIEAPTDARGALGTTVGGRLATALAGPRQLGARPLRDWVLRVRFVTGEARPARSGGVTVKDVTGFDLARLLCGAWGTLAVLTEVTLKVRPAPPHAAWFATAVPRERWLPRVFGPSAVVASPNETRVLLEGHPDDVAEQSAAAGLEPSEAPVPPATARLAVSPAALDAVTRRVATRCHDWAAFHGVGVLCVDAPHGELAALRAEAEAAGGSLLVLDPSAPGPALASDERPQSGRLVDALDPDRVLHPGVLATAPRRAS
ncbi:FAD-binding protein [Egibacter rhizosphaerae]|uniref:FAD-binding protein n=1 Tax=Egibacter rhizosphaerae TaxID=1670831 RepID=A0A411YBJ7_9ACTN|nr:FAD-binding protein [Egibacter rhizosphaerae]QBI18601.1 FAD-binding protein [Egibacter rhizosphaerae]